MNPLLSIVIATKNRVPYCVNAIETILSFPDNDFELIIQDNTDNLELKTYIESNISDQRLVYNYTPPPFSSIDNFNAAFSLASGEFVCLIGDDDGVIPQILTIARWANSKNIESVCSSAYIGYAWPGVYKVFKSGALTIPKYSEKVEYIKPLKRLPELLKNGILDYYKFNLPRVYHGLVRKSCMEEIKLKTGNYFGGLSPDIYSTIALSGVIEHHLVLNIPFTISGVCNSSTSADSSRQKHCGNLEDAPHLRSNENYIWEPEIPRYYSVQTIWAETCIKSIKENNIPISLKLFSIEKMIAASLISSYSVTRIIFEKTNQHLKNQKFYLSIFYTRILFYMLLIIASKIPKKISNALLRILPSKRIIHDIANISQATIILSRIFNREKYHFIDKL